MGKKNMAVMDTCSIILSNNLELGGIFLVDRLIDYFELYVPSYVIDEELEPALARQVGSGYLPKKLLTGINIISIDMYSSCLRVVNHWINRNKLKIAEGETHCLSLSLFLSRNYDAFVFLLSDDMKARDIALDDYLRRQKIGIALSCPDIILQIFVRETMITSEQALCSISDYYTISPARRLVDRKEEYHTWLREACRNVGIANSFCRHDCFQNQKNT